VELYPDHYDHFYIKRDKVVRFDAARMKFYNSDLPIFIRPCHSDQFVGAALRNMKNQVCEAIYISNPNNVERDIPEEFSYVRIPDWRGSDDDEQIFLILLNGEKYVREELEWWMVKLKHWKEPLKMKKIFRNGGYHFVNTKGGGFLCDAADFAEKIK
jgi:hypothetical protein